MALELPEDEKPSGRRCKICGRRLVEHDRVDLRLCKRAADERRAAEAHNYRKVIGVETRTTQQWLVLEQEAEERGFLRGRESLRDVILKWGIKIDTFPPKTDRIRYKCLECHVEWYDTRDAHPSVVGCAVEEALRKLKFEAHVQVR